MKLRTFVFIALGAPCLAHAAELVTFQSGDPIQASGINSNFTELEARINALESQIAASGSISGEPFRYGTFASNEIALATGYNYFITDLIYGLGVVATGSCSGEGVHHGTLSGSTVGTITRIPPGAGGGSCVGTGSHISLNTPIAIPGGETLTWSARAPLTLVGYRVAQ